LSTKARDKNGRSAGIGTPSRKKRGLRIGAAAAVAVGMAVMALGAIYFFGNQPGSPPGGQAGKYPYQVGSPGPGKDAPPIQLPSTQGGTFDLSSMRGKTVLLYFQEGITCQPCWDQLMDVETHEGKFKAFGIDQVVSVTTDPLDALKQKTDDEGIFAPVLSDPNLTVSKSYDANKYGMMGTSRDGHTFIVVGPDGKIKWRADYGGAPKYTMYVPVDDLLSDMRQGLKGGSR